ncbi:hypothetical protein EOI86_06655 [Hwanghaeella grinnelliae]|uniref:VPLPA-CTERM sorting domain-containing protein n=1 Tax=Hwanghaeella grinnelliae TaxID=2500179 RepID=A0A437QWU2_9PROT|nr:VPLPA-CTERM sorting domain-containing protein [Hwanghaeella grinnelliae]RVU38939.1 hypothetical protein EOI86_06655 [Hwanghaeella grinnelliae]
MWKSLIGAAALLAMLGGEASATVFDFFWSGAADAPGVVSTEDTTLRATGTIEINAAAGGSFSLSDIVSTDITVTGDSITDFTFTGWDSAGGTIAADGLSATFVASGNPFKGGAGGFFGCHFIGCDDDPDILVISDANVTVLYDSADAALASMQMTVSRVPVPAALPLLLSAIGGLGFMSWRRRGKASA